ncbi:MAG TPA: class I SAM-dependent methyltransferase [Gemmatimonadaceae bacterium]|nr:class I SAM-dependent methyltransferase [Gemmatimonadaceae bacterium]
MDRKTPTRVTSSGHNLESHSADPAEGYLWRLLRSGVVADEDGNPHQLHSNTSRAQCDFLQRLVREADARSCLEIGLAYGISSLAVCESIAGKADASLISIDPFQDAHWQNIGLLNLQRAGFFSMVEFHQRASHEVLPDLLSAGRRIDFAYVDTTKIFDVVMVDAFFLLRLLKVGGLIVFDDCVWPGIRQLVRYLSSLPHVRVHATHGEYRESRGRRIASAVTKVVPLRQRVFRQEIIATDEALGIDASCVAFIKIAEDDRQWDWSPRL